MKRTLSLILIVAVTATLAADFSGKFTFGGSTTVAPIAYAAIEEFAKTNPGAKISYEAVGSSTGIKQVVAGAYSLGGSSRELSEAEMKAGIVATPVGMDGLSVVVNKSVGIANVTKAQLADIYVGRITNWKQVGGSDKAIVVVNRDETSGTFGSFWELVCQAGYGKVPAYLKTAIVARENGEVAAKVAGTPGAIGYIGMAFADEVTKAGGKELYVDGVAPTVMNVVAKKYPLARDLYFVSMGAPRAGSLERAFVDFLLSAKGQAIVKATGYVPLPRK